MRTKWILLSIAVAVLASPSFAYKIRPKSNVHEAMTVLAARCAGPQGSPTPSNCRSSYANIQALNHAGSSAEYQNLQLSSHWSDDPTRQITPTALAKFVTNAAWRCGRRRAAAEQSGRTYPLGTAGILCSSHAGDLQFLHAMASAPRSHETIEQTREKILDWATFAFEVATGRIAMDADYCASLRTRNSAITPALVPEGFQYCHGVTNAGHGDGWRVASLFSIHCPVPLTSLVGCFDRSAQGDFSVARRNAAGAVLHLIQDSYSQSHTLRGAPFGGGTARRPRPVVDCALPTDFYYYNEQSSSQHSRADNIPALAETCSDASEADDAITATAIAIWHLRARSDPAEFRCYLERRVFGRVPRSTC